MSRNTVIIGTGSHVPANVVTNEEIIKRFENLQYPHPKGGMVTGREFLEKMLSRVGIKERRRIKNPDETTATLCIEAARKALDNAGVKPEQIDLIVLSTDSPDFISPPTTSRIQFELKAVNAAFFDLNAACAGFTIALNTTSSLMKADKNLKYALVLGGYGMTKYSDPDDPMTETLFADGAGAVVLEAKDDTNYGVIAANMGGDGKYWDYMGIYAGGTWKGFSAEAMKNKLNYVKFLKPFPAEINIQNWPPLIEKTIAKAGWQKNEVNKIFFTQIHLGVIHKVCDILGYNPSITHNIMETYGYTGSACVPMAIDDASRKGLLKPGDKIILCTSGGGAAFASLALVWGK